MRRRLRRAALVALTASVFGLGVACSGERGPEVVVYKTPTCGCCVKWMEHLERNGFEVRGVDVDDLAPIKAEQGVPRRLAACHTAVVDGYVVEGHVPADALKRLLEERPEVIGVATPGMPIGSPGMEGPNPEPFRVVAFDRSGARTFAVYNP